MNKNLHPEDCKAIEKLIAYMNEHPHEHFDITNHARMIGFSVSKLNKVSKPMWVLVLQRISGILKWRRPESYMMRKCTPGPRSVPFSDTQIWLHLARLLKEFTDFVHGMQLGVSK